MKVLQKVFGKLTGGKLLKHAPADHSVEHPREQSRTGLKAKGSSAPGKNRSGERELVPGGRVYSAGVPEIDLAFPAIPGEKIMSISDICVACHGCCFYITVEIEYPGSKEERDSYTWYLLHRNVEIFIDNDENWHLMFKTPCKYIGEDGMCGIYEQRPDICRDYSAESCSRTGKDHTHLFSDPEAMNHYLDRKQRSEKRKTAKKKGSRRKGSLASQAREDQRDREKILKKRRERTS